MNTGTRAVGTVIVYMTTAIVAELVTEVALILTNHGEFPTSLWPALLLGPLVGFIVAGRYWSESEFGGRTVATPLLFIGLLVVALAASSLFFARPSSTGGQAPGISLPQVSPSALPALPPAPTRDLRTYSGSTGVGNA